MAGIGLTVQVEADVAGTDGSCKLISLTSDVWKN
jgi:hypothetical protein